MFSKTIKYSDYKDTYVNDKNEEKEKDLIFKYLLDKRLISKDIITVFIDTYHSLAKDRFCIAIIFLLLG